MPRTYVKKNRKYTTDTVQQALEEIENGASLTKTAKKFFISYGYLHKLLQRKKANEELFPTRKVGKTLFLDPAIEAQFVVVLKKMESMGLVPTLDELRDIVHDYIVENNIVTRFTNDKPGYDWGKAFLKRNNLKLKKGTRINAARKRVTGDPLKTYYAWVERGRPLTSDNTPDFKGILKTVNVERNVEEIEERSETPPPVETSFNTPSTSMALPPAMTERSSESQMLSPETLTRLLKQVRTEDLIKELNSRMGPNMKFTFEPIHEKSVEEILHARGRAVGEKNKSRRAIQTKALILSQEKCLQAFGIFKESAKTNATSSVKYSRNLMKSEKDAREWRRNFPNATTTWSPMDEDLIEINPFFYEAYRERHLFGGEDKQETKMS